MGSNFHNSIFPPSHFKWRMCLQWSQSVTSIKFNMLHSGLIWCIWENLANKRGKTYTLFPVFFQFGDFFILILPCQLFKSDWLKILSISAEWGVLQWHHMSDWWAFKESFYAASAYWVSKFGVCTSHLSAELFKYVWLFPFKLLLITYYSFTIFFVSLIVVFSQIFVVSSIFKYFLIPYQVCLFVSKVSNICRSRTPCK